MAPLHKATRTSKLPYVYMVNFTKPLHLVTDAVTGGSIAYHIMQYHDKLKIYVPICWGSHKLSKCDKNLSQCETELLAIIYALLNQTYLLGFIKLIVHTDCRSLTYLLKFSQIFSKLSRWQIILDFYNLHFHFESSTNGCILMADLLSRKKVLKIMNKRPSKDQILHLKYLDLLHMPILSWTNAKKKINTFLQDNKSAVTPEMIKYINMQWEHFILFFSRINPDYVKTLKNLAFPYYNRHKMDISKQKRTNNLYFQAELG